MLNGVPPYKALLTHGFVVDGEGKKMSKSKGNVVAPQKVSDTLGADILRLWVAATDYSGDLNISDEILKRNVESYRRIRNTLRFLIANTSDFTAAEAPPLLPLPTAAALAEEISGELAKRNLELIARQHRMRGSRGYAEAAQFVAGALPRAMLMPLISSLTPTVPLPSQSPAHEAMKLASIATVLLPAPLLIITVPP